MKDKLQRTLTDLRISLIDRCNFRCPYCMPADQYAHHYTFLSPSDWLSFDEIERFARAAIKQGVRKIRLTGGEPLLRPQLEVLINKLSLMEGLEDLALTTNGFFLENKAKALKAAGLKRLTISLDSLDPHIFHQLTGRRAQLQQVLRGIDAAVRAGFSSLKINCVVMRGINEDSVLDLARMFRGTPHNLRFIEYMDVGNHEGWDASKVVKSEEVRNKIHAIYPLKSISFTRDEATSVSYSYEDGQGQVAFISAVSEPFCGQCGRLRLSAEGKLYTCLFANKGHDFRSILRKASTPEEVEASLREVWVKRDDAYSLKRAQSPKREDKVEMFHIGG